MDVIAGTAHQITLEISGRGVKVEPLRNFERNTAIARSAFIEGLDSMCGWRRNTEYLARMLELVNACLNRGHHNYVHGQHSIYCWDCFHNGMQDGADPDYVEREKIASQVPLDFREMERQLAWPYHDHILPLEYRHFYAKGEPMEDLMVYHCTACGRNIAGELEPVHECPLCGAGVEFLTEEQRPTEEQLRVAGI